MLCSGKVQRGILRNIGRALYGETQRQDCDAAKRHTYIKKCCMSKDPCSRNEPFSFVLVSGQRRNRRIDELFIDRLNAGDDEIALPEAERHEMMQPQHMRPVRHLLVE